jgi:hypothetical protein
VKNGRVIKTTRRKSRLIKTTRQTAPSTSKELSVKGSSGALVNQQAAQDLAEFGEISSQDLIIPRILVMQGLSDMVVNGDAKLGELRENINNGILGSAEKPLEVIPFKFEKVWREQEVGAKQPREIKPIFSNPSDPRYNEDLPYEFADKDGVAMKRYKAYRFFVMLPSKLQSMPHMVEFKSTSLSAGKKIINQASEMVRKGKKPYATVFDLVVSKTTNKKGTFAVLDVKTKRDISKEESEEVQLWLSRMKTTKVKVEEEVEPGDEIPF